MELKEYLENVKMVFDSVDVTTVGKFVDLLVDAYKKEKTIFVIGNGGSASCASHFAQDLSKGVFLDRTITNRIRTISLCDNIAYITAVGNDDGYEYIFETQLKALARPDDILIAISGSGNSKNVIRAIEYSKNIGATVVGVSGFNGGELLKLADLCLHVPLREMCTVEGVHSVVLHYIVLRVREILSGVQFDNSCFAAKG